MAVARRKVLGKKFGRSSVNCIVTSVKFGGEGIMLWGCFTGAGLSLLVSMKGTVIALAYQSILENFMLPTLWKQFGDGDSYSNMTVP